MPKAFDQHLKMFQFTYAILHNDALSGHIPIGPSMGFIEGMLEVGLMGRDHRMLGQVFVQALKGLVADFDGLRWQAR